MKTAMAFLLTLCCLPLCAQASKIEVSGEGDSARWTIGDSADIDTTLILDKYAATRGIKIVYDTRRVQKSIRIAGKDTSLTGDQIDTFVYNVLEDIHVTLARRGEGQFIIVQTVEAATSVPIMNEQEFATVKDWQWATVTVALEYFEPNQARALVQNLLSRQGGMAAPARNAILLTDRADRLRPIIQTLRELEETATTEIRGYDLPNGVDPAAALKAISALFADESSRREATFSLQEGTSRLLARVRKGRQAEVQQAVNALK